MQWCISVFIGDEFGGSQRFVCIFEIEIRHIQLMRLNSERSVLDCDCGVGCGVPLVYGRQKGSSK